MSEVSTHSENGSKGQNVPPTPDILSSDLGQNSLKSADEPVTVIQPSINTTTTTPPLTTVPVVSANNVPMLLPEMVTPKTDGLKEKAQAERSAKKPSPSSAPPSPVDDFSIVRLHRELWPKVEITPAMRDMLYADAKRFPKDWIIEMFEQATANHAKAYSYIRKVLMDWEANGKPNLAIVPKSADTTPAPVWTPPEGVNPFRPALPKVSGDNGHAT